MRLKGKIAVVTGGAKGIGYYTTLRLLNAGCKVAVWDYDDESLKSLESELKDYPDRLILHRVDVSDKSKVYECANSVLSELGEIHILVNNAGHVTGKELLYADEKEWEKTVDINLKALIYIIKIFLPVMYKNNNGVIVNISSASSTLGVPKLSVYTATKWAVWGFTESMRLEALSKGKDGIHFSTIHPSYIAEGMFEGAKLGFFGNLLAPLISSHDKVAKAIVNEAIMKRKNRVMIPKSVNLNLLFRGIMTDKLFQKLMILIGAHKSMEQWQGRRRG